MKASGASTGVVDRGARAGVSDEAVPPAAEAPPDPAQPGAAPVARPVHRLRDLDRRGRIWAAVFAGALLLAPALAFAWAAPDWVPANDPALMGLRALDVGTSRTPLIGQPSTSAHYIAADQHVAHPGPLHFYLLAIPVRVLGAAHGMVLVSVLITGACVLLAAWALFRQLGRTAGVLAAVALGAITFTTGAATLVNPVSSNIAGYPMLCSAVLVWCVVCGDIRLLPLTTAVVSFAAQQHLSVLPALGVATALGLTAGVVVQVRAGRWRDRAARRELRRWAGISAAIGLVLWSPVLLEQVVPDGGNLSRMVEFARDSDRPTVGMRLAVYQVVNVLGLPPLLGQTRLSGGWLLDRPTALTWVSAAVVVVLLAGLGVHWRRSRPRRLALVVMAGVLALAGLVNGASVPEGFEQYRLALYHWAWPLALLVVVTLGLGAADLARQAASAPALARLRRWRVSSLVRPTLAGCAVLTIAVPALVNPRLDRPSNSLTSAYSPVARDIVERAADEVVTHEDELDGEVVLLGRGMSFDGIPDALALMLAERGIPVRFTSPYLHYVDDEWLAHRETADAGLLVIVDDGTTDAEAVGELVAQEPIVEGFDREAFDRLLAQASTGEDVRFGPEVERALDVLPPDLLAAIEARDTDMSASEMFRRSTPEREEALATALLLSVFPDNPRRGLLSRDLLDFLVDHPLERPQLDPHLLRRLRDSLPAGFDNDPLRLSVYRLDRQQLLATATADELR